VCLLEDVGPTGNTPCNIQDPMYWCTHSNSRNRKLVVCCLLMHSIVNPCTMYFQLVMVFWLEYTCGTTDSTHPHRNEQVNILLWAASLPHSGAVWMDSPPGTTFLSWTVMPSVLPPHEVNSTLLHKIFCQFVCWVRHAAAPSTLPQQCCKQLAVNASQISKKTIERF